MIQYLKQHNPKEYQLIIFLTVTSVIGVLLIFVGVYQASRDLEIIHKVNNLFSFAQAGHVNRNHTDKSLRLLPYLDSNKYHFLTIENNIIVSPTGSSLPDNFPSAKATLEKSRINNHGGYIETENRIYTWAILPLTGVNKQLLLVHNFKQSSVGTLAKVYSKRLLVPGVFYIWLMVWVSLIIRFLTKKLRTQNQALEHMALHDSLTGMPNRTLLQDRLHKLIQDCRRNQRKFALAVIDLNKFKSINDTLGHDQGDQLLRLFAERIHHSLRASDTCARIGGDEFVLLLNNTDEESCITMCERIKTATSKPFPLTEAEVKIDISIGIALFPEQGEEATSLMRNADIAMYAIKSKGGGINLYSNQQTIFNGKSYVTQTNPV